MGKLPVLFHTPGACSQAVLIAAQEGAVELAVKTVNLRDKTLSGGGSLFDVNPLGQVSTLQLPGGELLTETSAILMWVQTQSGVSGFHRTPNDPDYFQIMRWTNFTATEIHKALFRVVFYDEATEAVKDNFRALMPARFKLLDEHLTGREYLAGSHFSAADAYLTWALNLAPKADVSQNGYTHLQAYFKRMLTRPAVEKSLPQG